jgi:hypothetical protein
MHIIISVGSQADIFLLTCRDTIYGNATSNGFVSGTAVHWYDYLSAPVPGTAGGGGGGLGLEQLGVSD